MHKEIVIKGNFSTLYVRRNLYIFPSYVFIYNVEWTRWTRFRGVSSLERQLCKARRTMRRRKRFNGRLARSDGDVTSEWKLHLVSAERKRGEHSQRRRANELLCSSIERTRVDDDYVFRFPRL